MNLYSILDGNDEITPYSNTIYVVDFLTTFYCFMYRSDGSYYQLATKGADIRINYFRTGATMTGSELDLTSEFMSDEIFDKMRKLRGPESFNEKIHVRLDHGYKVDKAMLHRNMHTNFINRISNKYKVIEVEVNNGY